MILAEQGPEDVLLFGRFIASAKARGFSRIVLECPLQAVSLLSDCKGIDEIVPAGSALPKCHMYCHAASLPLSLRLGINNLPDSAAWLNTAMMKESTIHATEKPDALLSDTRRIRLGIAFDKNFDALNRKGETAILDQLSDVSCDDVEIIELCGQESPAASLIPAKGQSWKAMAKRMRKTDVIVSTNGIAAHLAGAMGIQTYHVMATRDNWRWSSRGDSSTWYPSVSVTDTTHFVGWETILENATKAKNQLSSYLSADCRKQGPN